MNISLLGSRDETLVAALRDRRFRVAIATLDQVEHTHPLGSKGPDAFIVDVRGSERLPREIALLRSQFPAAGLVIVSSTLDPADLLEGMRMGVNEWVAEPVDVDQLVAALHRVAKPVNRRRAGRSIAIIGAKGGVGATTVAVNLATSLRRASKEPTLLVDLHLAHGDDAVLLGVEPRFSVLDALENVHRLDEAYLKGLIAPTKAGVDLLASSSQLLKGSVDPHRVRSLIEIVSSVYRFVVLDCPRADGTILEAMDAASELVVLANQELTTLRNATRIVNNLRQRCGPERVKLAISRFDPQAEIGKADVERVLGGPVKYLFPNDYRTSLSAITRGEPLILQNHSRLASSLEDVAHDLAGLPRQARKPEKSGLFGRFGTRS